MNCHDLFTILFFIFHNPFCITNHQSSHSLSYSSFESNSDDDLIGLTLN